jgi:hypothetical protein
VAKLADPGRKLDRALHHLEDLRNEVNSFDDLNPHEAVKEFDPKRGGYHLTADVPPIPSDIPLIAGDFVSNARAALDQAIFALAKGTKTRDPHGTQFPIMKSSDDFICRGKPMMAALPVEARTVIETMQPYHRTELGDRLRLLAALSNLDKHRTIPVVGASLGVLAIRYQPGERDRFGRMEGGDSVEEGQITAFLPIRGDGEVDFQAEVSFGVAFGKARGISRTPTPSSTAAFSASTTPSTAK